MSFTLGSDSEVFLSNGKHLVSAIGLVGGSKSNPLPTDHGYVQEDGVLAEFNVNPSDSEESFIQNTLDVLGDLGKIIKPMDLSIDISSSGLFEDDQLSHALAKLAGCEPDYDAWELKVNRPPDLETTNIRSCGGHLHVAFDFADEDRFRRVEFMRCLDLVAAVPSVVMDPDTKRRELYGKAGAHRPKYIQDGDPYSGAEYRSLSNFWLASPDKIGWAYRAVKNVHDNFKDILEIAHKERENILIAVNSGNVEMAEDLIGKYDLEVA